MPEQAAFDFGDAYTSLQTWRQAPGCAYGTPTVAGRIENNGRGLGWFGDHHCAFCCVEVESACASFDRAVARGIYCQHGYTHAEAKKVNHACRGSVVADKTQKGS